MRVKRAVVCLLLIATTAAAVVTLGFVLLTYRVLADAVQQEVGQRRPKLLCFVLSSPDRVANSLSVKETWGSRCDRLLFFSSTRIAELDSIVVPDGSAGRDGYYRLWGKVRSIWKYLRQSGQLLDHFDWFLKADDDTYIVVDNLSNFLLQQQQQQQMTKAVWFGARLRHPQVDGGYHSGGAGYVLNRRALLLFDDGRNCSRINFGYEDLQMGRCLEKLGVQVIDTRDSSQLPTFLPFSPEELLAPPGRPTRFDDPLANGDSWYWKSVWSPHQLIIDHMQKESRPQL